MRLKLPKPKTPPQPVEVEWIDAAIHMGQPEVSGMVTMLTCGYYVFRDRKVVKIAVDWDPADKEYRSPSVIPRVHIVRMTILAPEPKQGDNK